MELECLLTSLSDLDIGGEMSMHSSVLITHSYPCNCHHKVKQINATEYVVAVMAESGTFQMVKITIIPKASNAF